MSAAPSARAVEVTAVVPAPTPDPRKKADPVNPADEIKDACDADAVEVTLADPQGPPAEGKESVTDRAKEAQSTANRLGAGVEAEVNDKGQTLSWKRGKTPKSACREKLRRLRRDYPGRVSFEPTTSERVEEVRRRRDAMIPEAMRKNAGDASYHGGFFDSSKLFGSGIVPSADGGSGGITSALTRGLTGEGGSGVAASGLGPLRSVPGPTANAPTVQLPGQYHRIVSKATSDSKRLPGIVNAFRSGNNIHFGTLRRVSRGGNPQYFLEAHRWNLFSYPNHPPSNHAVQVRPISAWLEYYFDHHAGSCHWIDVARNAAVSESSLARVIVPPHGLPVRFALSRLPVFGKSNAIHVD